MKKFLAHCRNGGRPGSLPASGNAETAGSVQGQRVLAVMPCRITAGDAGDHEACRLIIAARLMVHHTEADTMSRPETCRIAATAADYQRYGIAKGEIAAWEDGFRTRPGGPGTFEWWYFDAVLDDGSTLVINFMAKDIRGRPRHQAAGQPRGHLRAEPAGRHPRGACAARE
jgi:hypothetical protein